MQSSLLENGLSLELSTGETTILKNPSLSSVKELIVNNIKLDYPNSLLTFVSFYSRCRIIYCAMEKIELSEPSRSISSMLILVAVF